jgi:toxin ParE1/3/4
MNEIKWRRRALRDMDHIAEYIARDNRDRAISFVHEIFSQVERLKLFPYLGRAGEKHPPDTQ